jgi:hypothetical protein
VAARQGVDPLLAKLAELRREAEPEDGAVLVSVADPQQEGGPLLRELLDAGFDVYECAPVRPSVEALVQEAYQ